MQTMLGERLVNFLARHRIVPYFAKLRASTIKFRSYGERTLEKCGRAATC